MRMLTGFEIWHGRICLFNTASPAGDTKRHANYINFQKWNVFGLVHLLITELRSICYEPGSNYQLQLLAPLRGIGDKKIRQQTKPLIAICNVSEMVDTIHDLLAHPNNTEAWIKINYRIQNSKNKKSYRSRILVIRLLVQIPFRLIFLGDSHYKKLLPPA